MLLIPTQEQKTIVNSEAKAIIVEAVAGAGKTTTLAMVAKKMMAIGVQPHLIAGLCFSSSASNRFLQKLSDEGCPKAIGVRTVAQFAGHCIRLLAERKYLEVRVNWSTDEDIRQEIVDASAEVWHFYDGKRHSDFDFSFAQNSSKVEEIIQLLFRLKASLVILQFDDSEFNLVDLENIAERFDVPVEAIEICIEYEKRRQIVKCEFEWQTEMDFVSDLVPILQTYPDAIECIPEPKLLLVDEWHDVNEAEFEFIRLILRRSRLVVVGDTFQTINVARGADTKFMHQCFENAFAGTSRLTLSKSHRFGNAVSKLSRLITGRPTFSETGLSTKVSQVLYDPNQDRNCAIEVQKRIKSLLESRVDVRHSDIAIIVRHEDQTIDIENILLDSRVPYSCVDVESYLLRPEILFLRGILHIVSKNFETLRGDKETCRKIIAGFFLYFKVSEKSSRWEKEYFAEKTKSVLKQAQDDIEKEPSILDAFFSGVLCEVDEADDDQMRRWKLKFKALIASLEPRGKTASVAEILSVVVETMNLIDATRRAYVSRSRADSANRSIKAFIRFAERYPKMNASQFIDEICSRQKMVGKVVNYLSTRKQVVLTTIQSAKGQEWKHVLIPYLEKGEFPRESDLSEEKRYFYVAVTRAKESVTIFEPNEENSHLRSQILNLIRKSS